MALPTVAGFRGGSRALRFAKRRVARRLGGAAVLVAALVGNAMCSHGEITVVEPAAKPPGAALTLTILPGESQAAAELGWKAGIPGAEVIIAPSVKPRPDTPGDTATGPALDTLMTDSAGQVSVADLAPGWYYVEVRRWLTDSELARLPPGEDLIGFMTQEVVERGSDTLYVPGSHRQALVISEWSGYPQWVPGPSGPYGGTIYDFGDYLELANNADTTVYLDGLVIGLFGIDIESTPPTGVCAQVEPFDNDPNGVWVYYMDSLPGTGHDYPLAPGAVAVIATDGIDHRADSPQDGLDLSRASFEFVGEWDPDNPGVPNTITIGVMGSYGGGDALRGGHGMILDFGIGAGIVVGLPVDTASLPRAKRYPTSHWTLQRIPRDHVLDTFLVSFVAPPYTDQYSYCPHQVNSFFDRSWPPWLLYTPPEGWRQGGQYSVQRKVAYTRADGRKILQDTRSTEADYFIGLRTPFELP
jgi:hypothetical protein